MLRPLQRRLLSSAFGVEAGRQLSRAIGAALDLLFPPTCAVCRSEGGFLHRGCEGSLPKLEKPFCSLCARPDVASLCSWCAKMPPAFDGISAGYLMEGAVREMVYGLKYRNLRASAPELGRLMAASLVSSPDSADVFIPVPLHKRRERERGYNQSELLAREVSKRTGVPVDARALRRTRDTAPQVSMVGHEERRLNTEGAFQCTADVRGKRILLIDDVVTTGSTMSACAMPLKAAGAATVWGLALARQARPKDAAAAGRQHLGTYGSSRISASSVSIR